MVNLIRRISWPEVMECELKGHPYEQIAVTQYDSNSDSLLVRCTGCGFNYLVPTKIKKDKTED